MIVSPLRSQSGVAMVTAILAIFILTVVVAGLTMATMGETGISFDQSRSSQALHLAEAGAYRALAELRRRMVYDLDANVRWADRLQVQGWCNGNQGWKFVSDYGGAGWVDDNANRRAVLSMGSAGAPIEVQDTTGAVLGSFYATIYVRPADNTPGPSPNVCNDTGVESYQMLFDYFIVATGLTRDAERTVCLKNPGNVANCGAWLASVAPGSPDPGDDTWDSPPASHGWMILIEKASYSRWALMMLTTSSTWLTDSATFNGPVHTNDRFLIWGDPTFGSSVSQVQPDVMFGNGGSPVLLAADQNAPTDVPNYLATRMTLGAQSILAPGDNNPWWAVLGDDPARSGMPSNADTRNRTTALADNGTPIPNGIYFMDQCANPSCGGIFVQGQVNNMVLAVESGKQTITIIPTLGVPPKKYILDSSTDTRECTGPPSYATCVSMGKGFNGVVFTTGAIAYTAGNPQTGLYGTVQQDTRLTIAADGAIAVTDHLVYEAPPAGANDSVQNVLGLYAWCSTAPTCPNRNVTVVGSMTPNDLYIDASVLSPWGKFWVEGWDTLPDKGTLHFLGGTVQDTFGEWGGFAVDGSGNIIGYTGYGRDMTFDARFLTNNAPPFFPLTTQYTAPRYPRLTPDPLYDRPLWEELAGQ